MNKNKVIQTELIPRYPTLPLLPHSSRYAKIGLTIGISLYYFIKETSVYIV